MTPVATTATTLTIGIDLGDFFSHFCVLDAAGWVLEEGRLRTAPAAFEQDRSLRAEKLARVARMDPRLLSPIQHREETVRADLAVLRARNCLVAMRTQLVNHVRGALKSFGARLSRCSKRSFSHKTAEQIPEALRAAMMPLLKLIDLLTVRIARYESSMQQLAEERYPVTELLRKVNGVGPVTSLAFVLIADARPLPSALGNR